MRKKFLAAAMGAAMVINVSSVVTLAEPVADSGTETRQRQKRRQG